MIDADDPTSESFAARPDVSVIIVSYHCRDDVLACVDSVLTGVFDHTLEVVVVDNGSTDGTVEALRAEFPEVTVLEMGENAGFARANNRGIAALDRPPRAGAQPRHRSSRPERSTGWSTGPTTTRGPASWPPRWSTPTAATSRPPGRSRRRRPRCSGDGPR